MANLANALKEEISRLARKEIRQQTAVAAKTTAQCERDIAALKRQVEDLQRKLAALRAPESSKAASTRKKASSKPAAKRSEGKAAPRAGSTSAKQSLRARFSPKSLKANRERLGLSADNYGKLVGVSGLSIYNWEQGKARPRETSIEALLKIKGIGKREAARRLTAVETPEKQPEASQSQHADQSTGES